MQEKIKYWAFLFLLVSSPSIGITQVLKGVITDSSREGIPYASVFVKELSLGTAATTEGFYSINLPPGEYSIVFQSLGFNSETRKITIDSTDLTLNIELKSRVYSIAPVTITNKSEDPALAIMRKAIGMAPYYQRQVSSFEAEVYIKGSAKVNQLSRMVKRQLRKEPDAPKEGESYVYESQNALTFKAPNTYSQKVIAARSTFPGVDNDMSIGFLTTSFYQPTFAAFISPLAPNAFAHYNFKYLGSGSENERLIHQIEFTPKRKNAKLMSGTLHIVNTLYCLNSFEASGEYFPGKFQLRVQFAEIQQNVWVPISQSVDVDVQALGNKGEATYITSIKYTKLVADNKEVVVSTLTNLDNLPEENNKEKPRTTDKPVSKQEQKKQQALEKLLEKDNLSNREMNKLASLMTEQVKDTSKSLELERRGRVEIDSLAYKRDTVKWDLIRPVPLQEHELKSFQVRDSVVARMKADTLGKGDDPSKSKKKSLAKVLATGGFYTSKNKKWWVTTDGFSLFNQSYNTVDGFVPGYHLAISRNMFKYKQVIRTRLQLYYSISRNEPMGNLSTGFRYWPERRGFVSIQANYGSRDFNAIEGIHPLANSVTTLLLRDNPLKLYHEAQVTFRNSIDLANGLVLSTGISTFTRDTLKNTSDFSLFYNETRSFSPNKPINPEFIQTIGKVSFGQKFTASIHYTPRFYYRMNGRQKVMIRSRYPTFSLNTAVNSYGKDGGLSPLMLELSVRQRVDLSVFRKLSYQLRVGGFFGENKLHFADFTHFNTQPVWVVLNERDGAFMLLPYYSFSTNGLWAQASIAYSAPFIALKYLPVFSNLIWNEGVFVNTLATRNLPWYVEFGYGATEILGSLKVAGYMGVQQGQSPIWGFRLGYSIGRGGFSYP